MQKVKLPVEVDPYKAAKRKLDYEGILEIKQTPRLNDSTLKVNKPADVWLRFETDPQGLVVLRGKIESEVELECQRCGEGFVLPLSADFSYSPVSSEQQAEQLPDEYEPLELDENDLFSLHGLLEDELLLALPIVPKHDLSDCKVQTEQQVFGKIEQAEESVRPNPFAVLEDLKKKD